MDQETIKRGRLQLESAIRNTKAATSMEEAYDAMRYSSDDGPIDIDFLTDQADSRVSTCQILNDLWARYRDNASPGQVTEFKQQLLVYLGDLLHTWNSPPPF